MQIIGIIAQIVIALGIFNVWLIRYNKPTAYRGGAAGNMAEEFASYGLPKWFMYLIGALKLTLAVALLVGMVVPALVLPAAVGMAVLMLGAIAMHIKVGDAPMKSVPAAAMLGLSIVAAVAVVIA